MSKHYLRVEAVNITNFVYDTHDVSTIRGGSFLLLDAINSLPVAFKERINPITLAASQGLFWFESSGSDNELNLLKQDILEYLNQKTGGHATFILATQEDIEDDFPQVLEKLEAQIHWVQWHIPTIAIPKPEKSHKECYLDGWRPGVVRYRVDPTLEDAWISESTAFRREEGVTLRRSLFFKVLGDEQYLGQVTSNDLGWLSIDSSKGLLSGKIAFITLDGNGFGGIRRKLCENEVERKNFDSIIQDFRNTFLKSLLELAKKDPDLQMINEKGEQAIRLEVLLWGGDEITFVLPAWTGWKAIKIFYDLGKDLEFKHQPLSHRAVMLFCHNNAPILLVRQLAENLLERTKLDIHSNMTGDAMLNVEASHQPVQPSDHEQGDALHYLVLESFDHLQGELNTFLKSYYKGINYHDLLIHAEEIETLLPALQIIKSLIPRSKLIHIIKAIQTERPECVEILIEHLLKSLSENDRVCLQAAIRELESQNHSRWYMVADLWDYLSE